MKLIAVTPEVDVKDEHKHLALLIAEGFIVHCRKPDKSAVELAAYLRKIAPDFRNSITIHSGHELAEDMGIKRLHFPVEERKKTDFEEEKFNSFILTTSVHDPKELQESYLSRFEYVFCGPVYDSISKKDYPGDEAWHEKLQEDRSPDKVAIGGMSPEKLLQISRWGFDGIAFSGYLWHDVKNLEANVNKIKEIWLKDLLL